MTGHHPSGRQISPALAGILLGVLISILVFWVPLLILLAS